MSHALETENVFVVGDDDQIIYPVTENQEEDIPLDPSKTTELELDAGNSHAMRIRFFYNNKYKNVLKKFINSLEKILNVESQANDTDFTVFITKPYNNCQ